MPPNQLTNDLTLKVEKAFYARCPPEERPAVLYEDVKHDSDSEDLTRQSSTTKVPHLDGKDKFAAEGTDQGVNTPSGKKPEYDSSLAKALYHVFFVQFWSAGLLKFISGNFHSSELYCQRVTHVFVQTPSIPLRRW